MNKRTLWLAGLVAVPVAAFAGAGWAASSSTAQSIMAQVSGGGLYAILDVDWYRFNTAGETGFYSNGVTSGPTVTCIGSPTGGCASSNQPAPAAPAPAILNASPTGAIFLTGGTNVAGFTSFNDRCTFFNGGTLATATYTETLKNVHGLNGQGSWSFTWTYTVAGGAVDPLTNWTLAASFGGTTAPVTLGAMIASESVLVSKQFPSGKYSFSLDDSTLPNGTRVQNLALTVSDDSNGNVLFTSNPVATDVNNLPGSTSYDPSTGAVDFTYTVTGSNVNGSALSALMDSTNSLPASGTSPADAALGDARSILNGDLQNTSGYQDKFTGNDNGGASQYNSSLAYATIDPQTVDFPAGSYTITLAGVVKGNSFTADQAFSVVQKLLILGPGCGAQQ